VNNEEVAGILHRIGSVLELKGEGSFRVRAYHNAGRIIASLSDEDDAEALILSGKIQTIRGIGPSIASKLKDIIVNGESAYLKTIKGDLPETLFDLLKIPGLGFKRLKAMWDVLGIDSIASLEAACKDGRVATLPRFSVKMQQNLLTEISQLGVTAIRRPREDVLPDAAKFGRFLQNLSGISKVKIAGSLRRNKETVKDIDLLCASPAPHRMSKHILTYPGINQTIASGKTKTSVRLVGGLQVDVRVVEADSFACALAYFTGSKSFNVALRQLALSKGYSLNEYSLRPLDGSNPPPISSEKKLHRLLGLNYIPPTQRETANEIHRQLV
jgi:DNA polymerase (family 10)